MIIVDTTITIDGFNKIAKQLNKISKILPFFSHSILASNATIININGNIIVRKPMITYWDHGDINPKTSRSIVITIYRGINKSIDNKIINLFNNTKILRSRLFNDGFRIENLSLINTDVESREFSNNSSLFKLCDKFLQIVSTKPTIIRLVNDGLTQGEFREYITALKCNNNVYDRVSYSFLDYNLAKIYDRIIFIEDLSDTRSYKDRMPMPRVIVTTYAPRHMPTIIYRVNKQAFIRDIERNTNETIQ